MPEELRAIQFGKVRRDDFLNFCAYLRLKFFEERVLHFLADRDEAPFKFGRSRQQIQPAGNLPQQAFAFFQLDIVTLAIGHCSTGTGFSAAPRKST